MAVIVSWSLFGQGGGGTNPEIPASGGGGSGGSVAVTSSVPITVSGSISVTNALTFGSVNVSNTVNVGQLSVTNDMPGVGATNLGKAEDAPHTSGDTGVFILGVRNDTNATFSSTDGDYTPIAVTKRGAVINLPFASLESSSNWVATATAISATTLAPANSSYRTALTAFQVYNSGGSATAGAITDGAGGTILAYFFAPAGGGSNVVYPTPIRGSLNTIIAVSNFTASTTILYSGQGFVAP